MFESAIAFNQDISSWDVSSGTSFVSGIGRWESWSSLFSPLELGALSLLLLSLKECCIVHAAFCIIIMLVVSIMNKINKTSHTILLFVQYRYYSYHQQLYGTTPPAVTAWNVLPNDSFQQKHFWLGC